jgi:O-antigen/teichoic acid export membrane protein
LSETVGLRSPSASRWKLRVPGGAQLAGDVAWIGSLYAATQVLRLATNIILARLLAPELFATMTLINTLRMGCELFTDVGVGQGIISRPDGDDPKYISTAWTLQTIRGLALFALAWVFASPIANFYNQPQLATLIPVAALIFVSTGVASPTRFILQKQLRVRKLTTFDFTWTLITSLISIALAFVMPGIWALMLGFLLGSALPAIASFFLVDYRLHRFNLDREVLRSIMTIGKWMFLSSLIYFMSMNFDRLYLAKAIPFALLGVYGIARTYSEAAMMLVHQIGTFIIFPKIAAHTERGEGLRRAIAPIRRHAVAGIAVILGVSIAGADAVIDLLYDHRYHAAGPILTILLVGSWFAVLATFADAIILGVGAPAGVALGNGVKLAWTVVALPLALAYAGLATAIVVLAAGEALRYVALAYSKRRHGLSFLRQDVTFTALFVITALVCREAASLVGLTGDIGSWITAARSLNG